MDHLPADFKQAIYGNGHGSLEVDDVSERRQILHALENTDWNKAKAARMLGMSRRTLYRKIDEHNITDPIR